MNLILNIFTLDSNISIFLQNETKILDTFVIDKKNSQAELLVESVERLLSKNNIDYKDIDCFSVVNGPGSFIGIKVAISFIKAIKCIYKNKKFITNNVFEILSFNENYDYVIIKADINNYYIYNKNNNIDIVKNLDNIEENSVIITNIENINKKNTKFKNISIENISLINYYKYKNKLFNDFIEPLYIREPQINKKNE